MVSPEPSAQTLPVLVADFPSEADDKGLFSSKRGAVVKEIPVGQLQEEMARLRSALSELMTDQEAGAGELRLSELSVQVEITASGGINLIGTAEVGATASLTLTFSR